MFHEDVKTAAAEQTTEINTIRHIFSRAAGEVSVKKIMPTNGIADEPRETCQIKGPKTE